MDTLNKILILYANSGAGHRRAAEALHIVTQKYFPNSDIRLFDVLDYTTPILKTMYPLTYLFMVNHCPWLWGFFYHFLDNCHVDNYARVFRRSTNAIHGKKFIKYMLEERPDFVLTTHFLPNELISCIKKRYQYKPFLITCITDYYPHAWWRDSGVDIYITPNQDLKPRLLKLGIPASKIIPIGIPIDPVFNDKTDKTGLRRKLGLQEDQFTVLITSGGFGVGRVKELVGQIKKITTPLQIIVVCGKNEKLKDLLTQSTKSSVHNFRIYGYVDNMHDFMGASDLMFSKSGGLTSTEAMAKGLPLIMFKPIPGQEASNCEYILKNQAGLRIANSKQARSVLEDLQKNPEKLAQFRENMLKIGRPQATEEIVACVKEILNER